MSDLETIAAFALSHLFSAGLLAALCVVIGHSLLRSIPWRSRLEQCVFSFALGSGVFGLLAFALAACGRLTVPLLVTLSLLAALPGGVDFARGLPSRLAWRRSDPRRGRTFLIALAAGLAASPIVILALYPPSAWDATMYHLPLARAYAESHSLTWMPEIRFAYFPQLGEILGAASLLLFDDVTFQLLQATMMMAVALAAYCLARELAGSAAGLWSACLWLSSPLVISNGTSAMIDTQVVLFSLLGVIAFLHWKERPEPKWAALAGAQLGLAAATKYLGLISLTIVGALILSTSLSRKRVRDLLLFATGALFTAFPFYLRTLFLTGTPTYPFLSALWGVGHGPWTAGDIASHSGGLLAWPANLAAAPSPVVLWFRRLVYIYYPFRAGAPISMTLLPAIAFAPFGLVKSVRLRTVALIAGVEWIAWTASYRDSRFLLPAVALLCVVAAAGMAAVFEKYGAIQSPARRQALTGILAFVLLLPSLAYSIRGIRKRGPVPTNLQQRDRYLSRLEGYGAVAFLNATHGRDYTVYGLFSEQMVYFAQGRWLGDWFGDYRYDRVTSRMASREELLRELRGMRATHFLVNKRRFLEIRRAFPALKSGPDLRLVYQDASTALFEVGTAFR